MITSEMFAEWKEHPVTKEIYSKLSEIKQDIKDQMAAGATLGSDEGSCQKLTALAVGQVNGLDQILNLTFNESEVFDDNDERSGY